MCPVPVTRETRPVAVLLGGSGRVRIPALRRPRVAALLQPLLPACLQRSDGSVVPADAS